MNKALVTGGAGFIGSHIVDALIEQGVEVVVVDDLSTGSVENVNSDATLYVGSINDSALMAEAARGCDVVFHQAAARAVLRSVEHPEDTNEANVGGTLATLVAARDAGVRRVVAASSSSVYGGASIRPTPESASLVPRSPYAVSKLIGEHYLHVFAELYGLETVALRYFNVYGPRQSPSSQYAAVIPLFINALEKGEPVEVHGDGLQSRDFSFIVDVVKANLCAAAASPKCSGRAYNIAGGRAWSLLDLLEIISDILGVDVEKRHTDPRPGDVRHTLADLTGAADDLGWRPETMLADGLRKTVAWFADPRSERAAVG